ncbi:MAG: flagellar basal body rod protein FlgC [Gemmatimonadales bacterium]|nr:MAG: flagellar basal body rod protein FlgC [Gemmatimonadales bacterium]
MSPGGVSGPGPVRGLLVGLGAPASGLRAQKARIDTIALNLANAGTTAAPGAEPFRRQVVEFESLPGGQGGANLAAPSRGLLPLSDTLQRIESTLANSHPARTPGGDAGVRVAGVAEDLTEGVLLYDPGHPDADPQGYVRHANVDVTREMIDLLEARRFFEANASVFEAMKSVLRRSIDI